ncbi:MAG: hypothetical protein KJ874_11330 [Acidobacteria bacterium]|nr:hypothetical protein [Acidobacteriota bacterium]
MYISFVLQSTLTYCEAGVNHNEKAEALENIALIKELVFPLGFFFGVGLIITGMVINKQWKNTWQSV